MAPSSALPFVSRAGTPLMSNAGKSIFSCQRDLDRFLRMYIDERRTHGARASQPSASASPLLATPTMRSISRKNLFAKSRQALLGTDDGASLPGTPTNASEQSQRSRRVMRPTDKRNLWPGLWRLTPEWREIVAPSYSVQASPCRKRQCTQTVSYTHLTLPTKQAV